MFSKKNHEKRILTIKRDSENAEGSIKTGHLGTQFYLNHYSFVFIRLTNQNFKYFLCVVFINIMNKKTNKGNLLPHFENMVLHRWLKTFNKNEET